MSLTALAFAALAVVAEASEAANTVSAEEEYVTFKAGAWGGAVAGVVLLVGVVGHRVLNARRDGYAPVETELEGEEMDVRGV